MPSNSWSIAFFAFWNSGSLWEFVQALASLAALGAALAQYRADFTAFSDPGDRKTRWDRNSARVVIVAAIVGLGATIEATKINDAENARLTLKADTAVKVAGTLGVKLDTLHDFVEQRGQQADADVKKLQDIIDDEKKRDAAAIAELNSSRGDLNKARSDAIAAAQSAKTDLAAMMASLKQEEAVLEQEKRALEPRDLLPKQQEEFVARMKVFAGLSANVFVTPSNTSDAGPLAQLLVGLLKKANWKTGWGNPIGGWAKTVLVCTGENPKPTVEGAAAAIILTLRADGIQSFLRTDMGPDILLSGTGAPVQKPDMTIVVGSKQ